MSIEKIDVKEEKIRRSAVKETGLYVEKPMPNGQSYEPRFP